MKRSRCFVQSAIMSRIDFNDSPSGDHTQKQESQGLWCIQACKSFDAGKTFDANFIKCIEWSFDEKKIGTNVISSSLNRSSHQRIRKSKGINAGWDKNKNFFFIYLRQLYCCFLCSEQPELRNNALSILWYHNNFGVCKSIKFLLFSRSQRKNIVSFNRK